ncbi:MAG: hypothetical protein JXN59_02070 [Anaerolineae bacterium]|nr:hypothetical protein [Anaerolineae bacterium]
MLRRYLIVTGILVTLLLMPLVGAAQSPVRIASLRVGLWPEYDQPSLLVIYWGELAPETSFPVTMNLRMPARIVAPHVVAAQAVPDGNVVEVPYEAVVVGDWRIVTFEANGPIFQFEYYDALDKDGAARALAYAWAGDYAVENLSIEFQMPPGAEDQAFSPALPESLVSPQDGLLYFNGQFGTVEAGEEFTFTARYNRSQDELTVAALNAANTLQGGSTPAVTAPVSQSASGGVDIVLLVVVAVVFFLLGAAAMRVAINLQELNRQDRSKSLPAQDRRKRRN